MDLAAHQIGKEVPHFWTGYCCTGSVGSGVALKRLRTGQAAARPSVLCAPRPACFRSSIEMEIRSSNLFHFPTVKPVRGTVKQVCSNLQVPVFFVPDLRCDDSGSNHQVRVCTACSYALAMRMWKLCTSLTAVPVCTISGIIIDAFGNFLPTPNR